MNIPSFHISKLKKLTRKQYIIAGAIVLVVVIVIGFLVGRGNGGSEVIVVSNRDVVEETTVSGRVEANIVADLGFEVAGRVQGVLVEEDETVKRGTVLVALDLGTLPAELEQARADVLIKEAELANAQSNLSYVTEQQDTLVESAYRKLLSSDLDVVSTSKTVTVTPPEVTGRYTGPEGQYKVNIQSREGDFNQYELRTFGIERVDPVKISETTPTPVGTYGLFVSFPEKVSKYRDTRWTIDIPNPNSSSYTTNLNAYTEALKDRDLAIDQARADVISQSGASIVEAELARARADVARIQAEIAQRRLTAPFAGVVTKLDIDPGEIVSANTVVASLISNDGFGVEVDLPEIDSVKVHVGDIAHVVLDAFGDDVVFDAVVASVDRAETIVDGVSVYESRLIFPEEDDRIQSGMTADVTITTDKRENVLAVPARAVKYREDGTTYVLVGNENNYHEEDVLVGLRGSDSYFEIISGLSESETVVVPKQ